MLTILLGWRLKLLRRKGRHYVQVQAANRTAKLSLIVRFGARVCCFSAFPMLLPIRGGEDGNLLSNYAYQNVHKQMPHWGLTIVLA